jgi:hypothetical protein
MSGFSLTVHGITGIPALCEVLIRVGVVDVATGDSTSALSSLRAASATDPSSNGVADLILMPAVHGVPG